MLNCKYYGDKSILKILTVISIIIQICIIIIIIYEVYNNVVRSIPLKLVYVVTTFVLITAYAITSLVILPLWFRSLCYVVSSDEIIIHSGVLVKKVIRVKVTDIHYTSVIKIPVWVNKTMNFLLINLCGKRVLLKFLCSQDMEEIDRIIRGRSEGNGRIC